MPAPALVHELVERFDRNRDAYRSGSTTRPRRGANSSTRSSRHRLGREQPPGLRRSLQGRSTRMPSRSAAHQGPRLLLPHRRDAQFFVEAKKPSVKLREDISAAFQLRRYAWSAKLPLSVLTDFEEFAVYDCRGKPDKSDKPSSGRVLIWTSATTWRAGTRSPASSRARRSCAVVRQICRIGHGQAGHREVDDAFLREIEGGGNVGADHRPAQPRLEPAGAEHGGAGDDRPDRLPAHLRGPGHRAVRHAAGVATAATSTTAGRAVPSGRRTVQLRPVSLAAEAGRPETPDELTLGLAIDDKPLKEILRGLYYPDSPYEFSVLPAEFSARSTSNSSAR